MNRLKLIIAALVVTSGCGGPVSLETDRQTYSMGQTGLAVSLTLKNPTSTSVFYSLCTARMERSTSSGWVLVGAVNSVCTSERKPVAPFGSNSLTMRLSSTLATGDYRFIAEGDPSDEIVSNTFTINSPD